MFLHAKLLCLKRRSDAEILAMLKGKEIAPYHLERHLAPEYSRAISLRRAYMGVEEGGVPYKGYDWGSVVGANCENIVGYVPVPLGCAGPVLVDGRRVCIPLATTEGALVASTHRGIAALNASGGCTTAIVREGMTRAALVQAPSVREAAALAAHCRAHVAHLGQAFNATSRFARLNGLAATVVGRRVHLRFSATTGDAMGMNMVTKGVARVLQELGAQFPIEVLSLSGNCCSDKKPAAVNWIEGRGKSLVAEAVVAPHVVREVLKSSVDRMVQLNTDKNLVGSAMAGSVGGFNAHAANIVSAMFIATGQDPAQVVEASNCIVTMEKDTQGNLVACVTMPCIEVGTVGGGTGLAAQKACLKLMQCSGPNIANPGDNARLLSRAVAAAVLAGELSILAALREGHLLEAHLRLNRTSSNDMPVN